MGGWGGGGGEIVGNLGLELPLQDVGDAQRPASPAKAARRTFGP